MWKDDPVKYKKWRDEKKLKKIKEHKDKHA